MLTKNFVPWVHVRFYFFTPLGDFHLLAASISHFLTAAMKFPCVSSNEIRLLCFESLFFCNPQITEGVNIKNNVEKDTTFLFFFLSLKVQMAMRFPSKQNLELHLGAIPDDWVPVVRTDGQSGRRTVTWLPKFLSCMGYQIFLPMVSTARTSRRGVGGGGAGQFQATDNATETQNTTLKTYGKLSLFIFLTLY